MAARRYLSTDPTTDDAVARLARQVADVEREVGTFERLRDDVAAHTRAITRLADALQRTTTTSATPPAPRTADGSDGSGGSGGSGGSDGADGNDGTGEADAPINQHPPAWLTVTDPQVAVGWLGELAVWVPRVWQPYLQTKTPPCWPWHPAVTAELLVVQHLWDEAVTAEEPGPGPLAAWHDRWRPGAAARITRLMAGCERAHGRHKAAGREYFYDTAYLDEVAHWWATTHGSDPADPTRLAPGLILDRDGR